MAKIIIFTGAGVSAESGISTFNDMGGVWENHKIEEVCSIDSLKNNREKTISFYDERRKELENKKPNQAHLTIAKLKNKYPNDIAVITQNVDDLFEKAGISFFDVIHLHGYLKHLRCTNIKCNMLFDVGYNPQNSANYTNDKCLKCSSDLRPNIVFYKEPVPQYDLFNKEIENCEMLVVIGTSGKVIQLNKLAVHIPLSILNNKEKSPFIDEKCFDKVFLNEATKTIQEISEIIENYLIKII